MISRPLKLATLVNVLIIQRANDFIKLQLQAIESRNTKGAAKQAYSLESTIILGACNDR